jgi:5-methylcytosine-specific restriction endonuclease McrA
MKEHSKEYEKFLKSDRWEEMKQQRMAIDGKCCMCGRPLNRIRKIQIHHVRYPNVSRGETFEGQDIYSDLATLCGSCHVKIHNFYNRIRSPQDSRLL